MSDLMAVRDTIFPACFNNAFYYIVEILICYLAVRDLQDIIKAAFFMKSETKLSAAAFVTEREFRWDFRLSLQIHIHNL